MINRIQQFLSVILSFIILQYNGLADQNDSSRTQPELLKLSNELSPNHYIAWGASIAVGDVNLGDDRGDLLLSMIYTRRLSSTTELECGLHYIAVHKQHTLDGNTAFFSDKSTFAALAWQADCAWTFQPFQGFLERFRLGIGPSFRFLTATYINHKTTSGPIPAIFRPNPNGTIDTLAYYPIAFSKADNFQGLSFGALVKLEYITSLSLNVDVIMRAQLHSYLPPIIRGGASSSFGGAGVNLGSVGVFLRAGW